ncbi:MAG: hypothetical protein ACE5EQ_06195 [Phycisphaerae bacterium]
MKTARRQELRTNELSQQIDRLTDTLKQHAVLIVASVLAAIFIVFGGYWYFNHQAVIEDEGWSQLIPTAADEDIETVIERFRSVAEGNINPALSRAAWLSIGDRVLSELYGPKPSNTVEKVEPDREKLLQTGRMAFTKVIEEDSDDITARGRAMLGLAVLIENQGDIEKARTWYQNVIKDPRFDDSPFEIEATYRLAGLDTWSKPIEFPEPPPIELVSSEPPGLDITPVGDPSVAGKPKPTLALRPPFSAPAATTQPADDGFVGPVPPPGTESGAPPVAGVEPRPEPAPNPKPDTSGTEGNNPR